MSLPRCSRCRREHPGPQKTCQVCRNYVSARRKQLVELGVCATCKEAPCVLGRVECKECLAFNARRRRSTLQARRAQGLCSECGRPARGYVCAKCKGRLRRAQKRDRLRRLAEEVCRYCRKEHVEPDKTGCRTCLDERAEYQRKRLEIPEKLKMHVAGREARYAARKAAGVCIFCQEPSAPFLKCERCRALGHARWKLRQLRKREQENSALLRSSARQERATQ